MPIARCQRAAAGRLCAILLLLATYLVLACALNPVLLAHELALPTDSQHHEHDVCSWLDHAAASTLHAAPPSLCHIQASGLSLPSSIDPILILSPAGCLVRGPPSL
ncbi:MAG: hypothetical protein U0172_00765 [Nitrospiraceae bacterium]